MPIILLNLNTDGPNGTDEAISKVLHCHRNTVRNVRQQFVEQGLEAALERKKQAYPSRKRILDGEKEARLIALSCSSPPKGRLRWTLKMLADQLVDRKSVV